MKKLIGLFLIAGMVSTAAMAQDNTATSAQHSKQEGKSYVKMIDGKVMVVKDGNISALDKDLVLPNGTTVSTTGTIKLADGTTTQLKDGDKVNMEGKVKTKSSDNTNSDPANAQLRDSTKN